jgi:hypothetical protein
MKNIKIIIKTMLFLGVVLLTSCKGDITELDLTDNPNYLTPNQADADYLLNRIQVDFAKVFEKYQTTAGEVSRLYYMNGKNYANAYSSNSFDTRWRQTYADIFMDIKAMKIITNENGMRHHEAMSEVIEAYLLSTIVDFFGDVPYSEYLLGDENLNPSIDSGASIYEAAHSLLDNAITKFGEIPTTEPQNDFYYNKDWSKWIKAANTIKMNMYVNTRLVDNDAINNFNAIVSSGNYINTNADDFQYRWGKNISQPDTRHPRYKNNYTSTGGNEYMSNSLMKYMIGLNENAYLAPDHFDPRVFFYFYRQSSVTPGFGGEPADEELLECTYITPPSHYDGYVYCGMPKGWWGRDHGNDKGIPPDNFKRTLAGAYPAGGKLDDLDYSEQKNGDGFGGNGITPMMLATWTKFMIAEMKMDTDESAAKTALLEGIELSWDKVYNFYPVSERFNIVFDGADNLPVISDYFNDFKTDITDDWDTGTTTDRWNILAHQYWVASYGNGMNTYNFYRRTGFPTDLQPNLEPNPGSFIRSFYYPSNLVNNNSNASQKDGVGVKVYWDNNPDSPGFPTSN